MARTLALVLVLLLALPCAAGARAFDPPSPANSTVPFVIHLVGASGGAPDAVSGQFTVTVRDIAYNPEPGDWVVIDFSACTDVHMAGSPVASGDTARCAERMVGTLSDAHGVATFTIVGASAAAGPYSGGWCAAVYGNGMLLGNVIVTTFDLNGTGGVTAADLSLWLGDMGSHEYRARSDFDGNGVISAADLSVWMSALARGGSTVTGAYCP